jgi:dTDP-4-dehydrorhamnose 3,5-epimerase
MKISESPLSGVWLVEPEPASDARGFFARVFSGREFRELGLCGDLTEVSISRNHVAGTLRGMHFQRDPHGETKLVRVVRGRVFDVAVDIRPGSPAFGRWHGLELSAEEGNALYIPAGFAHGFLTLEENTDVMYQITDTYNPASAAGFAWNDPSIGIAWPFKPSVMSDADRRLPPFETRHDS